MIHHCDASLLIELSVLARHWRCDSFANGGTEFDSPAGERKTHLIPRAVFALDRSLLHESLHVRFHRRKPRLCLAFNPLHIHQRPARRVVLFDLFCILCVCIAIPFSFAYNCSCNRFSFVFEICLCATRSGQQRKHNKTDKHEYACTLLKNNKTSEATVSKNFAQKSTHQPLTRIHALSSGSYDTDETSDASTSTCRFSRIRKVWLVPKAWACSSFFDQKEMIFQCLPPRRFPLNPLPSPRKKLQKMFN